MPESRATSNERPVALLAEGVDRNFGGGLSYPPWKLSPSSRRAWIEILMLAGCWVMLSVALLAEGAGRNRHKNMVNSYYRKARN